MINKKWVKAAVRCELDGCGLCLCTGCHPVSADQPRWSAGGRVMNEKELLEQQGVTPETLENLNGNKGEGDDDE